MLTIVFGTLTAGLVGGTAAWLSSAKPRRSWGLYVLGCGAVGLVLSIMFVSAT